VNNQCNWANYKFSILSVIKCSKNMYYFHFLRPFGFTSSNQHVNLLTKLLTISSTFTMGANHWCIAAWLNTRQSTTRCYTIFDKSLCSFRSQSSEMRHLVIWYTGTHALGELAGSILSTHYATSHPRRPWSEYTYCHKNLKTYEVFMFADKRVFLSHLLQYSHLIKTVIKLFYLLSFRH
jgi:hypothetical protein